MKTIIFNGSPRIKGDTIFLINELKKHLDGEVKVISSYYDNIKPCNDCRYCWDKSECIKDDDMQHIYQYIIECDTIIIASPIYFSELTGSLLNVFSRFQMFWTAKMFRNEEMITKPKKGAVILCGGGQGDYGKAEGTAKTLLKHLKAEDYLGCVISENTDNIPSREDKAAIKEINNLAKRLNA